MPALEYLVLTSLTIPVTMPRRTKSVRSSQSTSRHLRAKSSLPELIDLAEAHNPQTRVAWERARAQAAALGVARSELYPTLAAAALSGVARSQAYLVDRFYRQTIADF